MPDFIAGILLGYVFGCAISIMAVRRAEQRMARSQQQQ